MTLDSSNSSSTAKETKRFQSTENKDFPKGKNYSEPERITGSAIKKYPELCTSWSYLFVHNQKVKFIESQLKHDGCTYFVHRTIKYVPRRGRKNGVREVTVPSVSGLIFLQGESKVLQAYLDDILPYHKLCKNCSTGETAVIPDCQMKPFMRVAETAPDRIRFLLRPFVYYSKHRTLLRVVSGEYAGLEGYVVRMARDRKLVMDVGGMSIAIGGIHAERFEEVGKNEANKYERATFYKRSLHERNAFIDRYYHQVKTEQEVVAQAENIDILRLQTILDMKEGRIDKKEAFEIYYFMIEEIGYYYAPILENFKDKLSPILIAGQKVLGEIEHLISTLAANDNYRLRWESEVEELKANYGYLFDLG